MKKYYVMPLAIIFALLLISPVGAQTGTKAWLNGYIVDENVPILRERGKIYIPVDKVAEYYGLYAKRKPEYRSLFVFEPHELDNGNVRSIDVGNLVSMDESEQIYARYSEAPRDVNGHFYQTLKDAQKFLDEKITYDAKNNVLVLSSDYYPGKQPKELKIYVDGHLAPAKFKPFIQKGRTMVPLRFITETIGGEVDWHAHREYGMQGMTVRKDSSDSGLLMWINHKGAYRSPEFYANDTFPVLRSETTYVPLRFVADYLGLDVVWDSEVNSIYLMSGRRSNMEQYLSDDMVERYYYFLEDEDNNDFSHVFD